MVRKQSDAHLVLFQFIHKFLSENGYIPSYDEILKNTQFKSKGHVHYLMGKLENLGLIERQHRLARSVQISKPTSLTVPFIALIAAGEPIHMPEVGAKALRAPETLDVPESSLPLLPAGSEIFAL